MCKIFFFSFFAIGLFTYVCNCEKEWVTCMKYVVSFLSFFSSFSFASVFRIFFSFILFLLCIVFIKTRHLSFFFSISPFSVQDFDPNCYRPPKCIVPFLYCRLYSLIIRFTVRYIPLSFYPLRVFRFPSSFGWPLLQRNLWDL